jgi:hypothetical protein
MINQDVFTIDKIIVHVTSHEHVNPLVLDDEIGVDVARAIVGDDAEQLGLLLDKIEYVLTDEEAGVDV